jgi:hypothetical protein
LEINNRQCRKRAKIPEKEIGSHKENIAVFQELHPVNIGSLFAEECPHPLARKPDLGRLILFQISFQKARDNTLIISS